jgi:uncharacterized protein YbjT (DUF2867 family)
MHVILGATGHVGSAVAAALLERNQPVTVVTRDARRAEPLTRRGAVAAVADLHDTAALRAVLQRASSAFVLMPPAAPSTDTVAEERRTVSSLVRALRGVPLRKVVVQSTYGAQPGERLGDLSVLHELEQGVLALGIRTSIVRAAYYMTNWDSALTGAREEGVVHSFFPPDFVLPMVAPADLGPVAARLLTDSAATGVCYVEGPAPYSPADVASAFARVLKRDVRALETPRAQWHATFQALGFSEVAADSYARMTAVTLAGAERPPAPERGRTTLLQHIQSLARAP